MKLYIKLLLSLVLTSTFLACTQNFVEPLNNGLSTSPIRATPLTLPAAGQYYHGVMPYSTSGNEDDFTAQDIESYEDTVGHQAAWIVFSNNWYAGRQFPASSVNIIRDAGATPYIRLMLRSDTDEATPETFFTLDAILRGDFDDDLDAWARKAASYEIPLIVEWGTEMNGQWFSWNGVHNGGAGVGPQKFIDAYRHIIRRMDNRGATNISWVFHVNYAEEPFDDWNKFENYYPGDGYIDLLGVSIYTLYTPQDNEYTDFRPSMDETITRFNAMAPQKPVILSEFGATTNSTFGDAAVWADAALADIMADRWPSLVGFSWWNERWPNDDNPAHDTNLLVQSDPDLAAVFNTRLNTPKVIKRPLD